jgi:hypothetical protein
MLYIWIVHSASFLQCKGYSVMLGRVQDKAAKFAHHRIDSNWETLAQRRKIALKAHTGCKVTRSDLDGKIRGRKWRTDIEKCSFVSRTKQLWNQLPVDALGLYCKPSNLRKRFRKVINEGKWRSVDHEEMQGSEVKRGKLWGSEGWLQQFVTIRGEVKGCWSRRNAGKWGKKR